MAHLSSIPPPVRSIRAAAGLSRPELARFLGVTESTVTRWETLPDATEPAGLQAVLLHCLLDALALRTGAEVASVVRLCAHDHRRAIKALLEAAEVEHYARLTPCLSFTDEPDWKGRGDSSSN